MGFAIFVKPALDDLDTIEICADRIAQCINHEGWCFCFCARRHVTTHGNTFFITVEGRLAAVQIVYATDIRGAIECQVQFADQAVRAKPADSICESDVEMFDADKRSVFGAIDQEIIPA